MPHRQGAGGSYDDTQQGRFHAFDNDHAKNIANTGAQGQTDSDFLHAPFHAVREHAVDPNRRQQQGESGEDTKKKHVESLLS